MIGYLPTRHKGDSPSRKSPTTGRPRLQTPKICAAAGCNSGGAAPSLRHTPAAESHPDWTLGLTFVCRRAANPHAAVRPSCWPGFDRIFKRRAGCAMLDLLLTRLHANKAELLTVLDRPEIPLHTNGSENNIRCQVIRRKICGGTRSEAGALSRGLPRPQQNLPSSASPFGTISVPTS
ncbi:MAG: hypothetical protein E5X49_11195 [Mesorhizobium sp.]|uniref:IS66 family transposase n=1 Tax=Mesorhizobium sp. TaxID=1871066 RepID=UPI00120FC208|nr:MAG: hypothetical protein E5X49_11195 [Mesorhizobium sp.]